MDRITVLAQRDDVAFVELACPACGSETIGLLMSPAEPDGDVILDVAMDGPPTAGPSRTGRFRPITDADVAAIRDDLAAWQGDLVGWLETLDDTDRPRSVVDR